MNRPLLRVALLLAVSGSCLAQNSVPATKIEPPAKAEEPKRLVKVEGVKIESDGVALYDAARDAAKKVKDLSCKITTSFDSQKPVEGEIVVVFKDGAAGLPIGNYSLKGAMGDKKLVAVFDGKVMRTIDHVEKQLLEMPAQNGVAFPRDESGMLIPNWYIEARILVSEKLVVAMVMGPPPPGEALLSAVSLPPDEQAVKRTAAAANTANLRPGIMRSIQSHRNLLLSDLSPAG